ncbi:DNA-processing protein DprA [Dapis sp. BLCC M172]|uniref:DNA-processing protein DprA n=1 Tax=Dapis sp. BLCC M172 TaxID=2975281 RepID=UPI003CF612A1
MSNHVLSPDAQAIMLLCASFGENRNFYPEPLTLSEYNRLAKILIENQLRPGDLLSAKGLDILPKINDKKLNYERLIALLERGGILAITVEKWVNQGLWIITRSEQNYPIKLKHNLQHLAPVIIYGVGNIELLKAGGLAIVGSRDINEEEIEYTNKIGKVCASQGINIISGGAKGIDQEAMLGTLEVGGTVIGVLADSLNKASVSRKYRDSIRSGKLTLISTYDPNAGFNVGNAMGRNKYIYALSDYALVVSSSLNKGGTWAGATEVLNKYQKIPVFVKVEGQVKEGNQALLDRGAKSFPIEPWNSNLKELLSVSTTQSNLPENNSLTDLETPLNISAKRIKSKVEIKSNLSISEITNQIIYEKVLPIILENLKQPHNEKDLSKILKVRVGQLRNWLNQACAEEKIIKTKNPVNYRITAETKQYQNHQTSTQQLNIYEAVLPIILENLEKPQTDQDLATKLSVNISQLQDWLKTAKTEGKIISENQSNTYVISQDIKQLSLFDKVEDDEEGLDW